MVRENSEVVMKFTQTRTTNSAEIPGRNSAENFHFGAPWDRVISDQPRGENRKHAINFYVFGGTWINSDIKPINMHGIYSAMILFRQLTWWYCGYKWIACQGHAALKNLRILKHLPFF